MWLYVFCVVLGDNILYGGGVSGLVCCCLWLCVCVCPFNLFARFVCDALCVVVWFMVCLFCSSVLCYLCVLFVTARVMLYGLRACSCWCCVCVRVLHVCDLLFVWEFCLCDAVRFVFVLVWCICVCR